MRYNGKVRFAVFADEGPSYKFGEGSMALAEALGIDSDPKTGGVAKGVEYIVFPCSGDGTPGTPEGNNKIGTQLLKHQSELMAKLRMQGRNT